MNKNSLALFLLIPAGLLITDKSIVGDSDIP